MEAFARSMDEYFAPEHTAPSHQRGGISGKSVRNYSRTGSLGSALGSNSKYLESFAVSHLIYYITLTTLMDMSLQFAYPSTATQRGISIWCLILNALQVIAYLGAMGLILYMALSLHVMDNAGPRKGFGGGFSMKAFGRSGLLKDVVMYIPISLVLTGYVLALSILINATSYNRNLTTGANVVLNLPRVICIIFIIIFLHHAGQKWKTCILGVMFFLCVFCTGCAQAQFPATSKIFGIITFLLGIGSTIGSVILDVRSGGGIKGAVQGKSLDINDTFGDISEHVNNKYTGDFAQLESKINENMYIPEKLAKYKINLMDLRKKINSSTISNNSKLGLEQKMHTLLDRINQQQHSQNEAQLRHEHEQQMYEMQNMHSHSGLSNEEKKQHLEQLTSQHADQLNNMQQQHYKDQETANKEHEEYKQNIFSP